MEPISVALFGPDQWLRVQLTARLADAGAKTIDLASGASSIRQEVDVLVCLPRLMPEGAPTKDVGAHGGRMTFAAAAQARVDRVVVVSRVGPDHGDPYLEELRALETTAARVCSRVTVVRVAHPIGDPTDPGPVVAALAASSEDGDGQSTAVQPILVTDLVDVVHAAIDGHIGAGAIEIGGPRRMSLAALRGVVGATPLGTDASRTRRRFGRRNARATVARDSFLHLDSVPRAKFAPPIPVDAGAVEDLWVSERVGER